MRHLRHILALIFLLAVSAGSVSAQIPGHWDEDIRFLRKTAVPGYHCVVDDYTQYAPAAVMLIAKACGYDSRTGWGRMLTADAFSIAIMTGVTQGMKYTIRRKRPDCATRNSFPSGHTGTAFMTATLLHKEYGWRSPWWSIGGYTLAAFTGVSRILNDRHWMSDVVTGAAIGIGSVHLGYFLSDLIFKGKYINPAYERPTFSYDPTLKHYVAETYFGRRFILGGSDGFIDGQKVVRGGIFGLSTDIPIIPGVGVTARLSANSLTYSSGLTSDMYTAAVGGFYNIHIGRRFEFQAKALAGLAHKPYSISTDTGHGKYNENAADLALDAAFSFMLDDNFKIKAFAGYEALGQSRRTWMHSAIVGWGAAWLW